MAMHYNVGFMETSAKQNQNIEEVFCWVTEQLLKQINLKTEPV